MRKVLRVRALDQIGPSGELTWGGRVDSVLTPFTSG
jgi:hypothetical protein